MPTVRIIQGHVLAALKTLPDESVHVCCSSPPYWGLRSYGTDPQIWGGDPLCPHVWGAEQPKPGSEYREGLSTSIFQGWEDKGEIREAFAKPRRSRHVADVKNPDSKQATSAGTMYEATGGQFCQLCGAYRVELGSENTPEHFISHLVEVFRAVKRVLRSDGICAVNLGDSYTGGKGGGGKGDEHGQQLKGVKKQGDGLKSKDLCEIPSRFVLAMQVDGWWLRSRIPWVKRSAMPESCTDRPGSAVEYWFMLTKSARCFYDGEAVKIASKWADKDKRSVMGPTRGTKTQDGQYSMQVCGAYGDNGRNRRNSDWYFDSLRAILDGASMPMQDEDGNILALPVNTQGTGLEHYAGYPPAIVAPFILAGSSEKGVCSQCGAPWVRVVEDAPEYAELKATRRENNYRDYNKPEEVAQFTSKTPGITAVHKTIAWCPSCSCVCCDDRDLGGAGCTNSYPEPVPGTVLDPFLGSGTTAVVAVKLGRNAIGCELSPKYVKMATKRIRQECGLLAEISVERIEQ